MNNTYFVSVDGIEVASNLTKVQAIDTAKKQYEKTKCALAVGIGRIKYVKGKRVYNCLPMRYYST